MDFRSETDDSPEKPEEYDFKIVFFKIDSYITKPHLILDETYSAFRKENLNVATVVRVFGCTDNGIKTCVHIHQYFPHFTIRQKDLAVAYGIKLSDTEPVIDRAIIDTFVNDLEDRLVSFLDKGSRKNQNDKEIFIVDIKQFDAFSFYGYHESKEMFYKVYFNSYWMANKAKELLESGLINNRSILCHNFLEFNLQFYVDNQIYLNELYFKTVSFRRQVPKDQISPDSDSDPEDYLFNRIKIEKLKSIKSILNYNDLPGSSNCVLECDALISDLVQLKHEKLFPENVLFNPTLPGIIRLWNNQYQRLHNEFNNLLNCLKDPNDYPSEDSLQFKRMKSNYLLEELFDQDYQIPQLDGPDDSDSVSMIFQGKTICLNYEKLNMGIIQCQKLDCSKSSPISVEHSSSKYELLSSIQERIVHFETSKSYLNQLRHKRFRLSTPNPYLTISKNKTLKLYLLRRDAAFHQSTPCDPKKRFKLSIRQASALFGQSSRNLFSSDDSKKYNSFDQLKPELKWTKCLNLAAMSLEVHARIRHDLTPDPRFDPVEMVVFCVYEIPLKDSQCNDSSNCLYIGAIVVNEKLTSGRSEHLKIIKNKMISIDHVPNEIDLFNKLSGYVCNFDPDIIVGYVIDTFSWGYLLQRAVNLGMDIGPMFSRITCKHQSKRNSPGSLNHCPEVIGRISFNTWRMLRHELALRSYSFENVIFNLFGHRYPKFSNQYLNQLWQNGFSQNCNALCKQMLLEYYLNRVLGTLKILTHLDLIRRTFDLSCLFGMQLQDVLDRGTQFRVESMLFPLCHQDAFLPIRFGRQHIKKQVPPRHIPLIFEPDITFHREPVAVLDFQSLYPSVAIANNYCYSTCLGRMENIINQNQTFGCYRLDNRKQVLKSLPPEEIHMAPNDVLYVKPSIRKGIMPRMLEEVLNTRIMIKKELKNVDKRLKLESAKLAAATGGGCVGVDGHVRRKLQSLRRQLDVWQLGLKLISNVTYGYTAANFSGRMPCVEIADSIVSKGRQTLEEVITFINDWGLQSGTNVKVIYGDTDSVFISFPQTISVTMAFDIATFIMEQINQRQPYPICLKLEKIYQPCILMAKKRYCGYMYESPDQTEPIFDAKGIETVRRDSCNLTAKIMKKCLKILFDSNGRDIQHLKPYIQWQFNKILLGRFNQLDDFIFAKRYAGFSNYSNQSIIPACIIATRRIQVDPRNEPKFKERVPYVIALDQKQRDQQLRLADMVHNPFDLLHDHSLKLNSEYYIKNTIIPPLARVLESLTKNAQTILQTWFDEIKNSNYINNWIISDRYYRKFQNHIQPKYLPTNLTNNDKWKLLIKPNANHNSLNNEDDITKKQKTMVHILENIANISHKLKRFKDICAKCSQTDFQILMMINKNNNDLQLQTKHACIVDNCANLYRYHQALRDIGYLRFLEQNIDSMIEF